MHRQAKLHTLENQREEGLNEAELLKNVVSLRHELNTMSSDIQVVLSENARLKDEISQLQQQQQRPDPLSEMKQMKDELDQLIALHKRSSSPRRAPQRPRPRARVRREPSGGQEGGAWMKKMMMVMMMADLM